MAYANPRGLGVADMGPSLVTAATCTLADYTAGGTTTPAVDDIVTFSASGNHRVKRAADNQVSKLGRVTKIGEAPVGTAEGVITVEWLDIIRFVELPTDDLSTVTLGNSCIKDGDTSVAANVDAGAATGNLIAWAKSGTSGAGTVLAAAVGA